MDFPSPIAFACLQKERKKRKKQKPEDDFEEETDTDGEADGAGQGASLEIKQGIMKRLEHLDSRDNYRCPPCLLPFAFQH